MPSRLAFAAPYPRQLTIPLLAVLAFVISSAAAEAAPRDRYFDVRTNFADERVIGSTNVHIAGMDPLSTPWSVGVKATAITPPDISFITSIPAAKTDTMNAQQATVTPPPTQRPQCVLPIAAQTLGGCIDAFEFDADALDATIRGAADGEQGVQRQSAALLADPRWSDLRNPATYQTFRNTVAQCIFAAEPAVLCPRPGSGTSSTKPNAAAAVQAADTAYARTYLEYVSLGGGAALNAATDPVKARVTTLKAVLDAEKTQLDAVDKFEHDTLDPLTIAQYFYEADVRCGALFNAGREKTITLTLGASDTRDVTVVCPTPVFVSVGIGTDGLSNRTFTSVAPNTAGQPAPAAGATPQPSVIAENDRTSRVLAQTMLHLGLGEPSDDGSGFAYSLGVGAPVFSGGGGGVDLLTGFSYVYRRTVVITAGIAYGKTLDLAPGYAVSGPLAPGATVPTLKRYGSAFFFGVSFAR
jgi:hypothetical protein